MRPIQGSLILALVLVLAACVPGPVHRSATADSVMGVQYAAKGSYGAMTGEEASRITHSYGQRIGAPLPARSSTTSDDSRYSSPGRTYDR